MAETLNNTIKYGVLNYQGCKDFSQNQIFMKQSQDDFARNNHHRHRYYHRPNIHH